MASTPSTQILPPPPPGSDWKTKILWYLAGTAANALIYTQFDYGQEIQATGQAEGEPDTSVWMHVQVVFEDTVSQDKADNQVFTLDIVNYTGDLVDPSWTDADFSVVDQALNTFVGSLATSIIARLTWTETRFYRRAYNPYANPIPFAPSGGPAKVITHGVPGTGSGAVPPQCTSTVTEMTPSRRHWGRFYLPSLAPGVYAPSGRLNTVNVDAIAASAHTLFDQLGDQNFRVVVPTTSSGGTFQPTLEGDWSVVPARTLQQVTGIRVDDVADVHRQRRHKNVLYRKTLP